jgi:hypothetical protein
MLTTSQTATILVRLALCLWHRIPSERKRRSASTGSVEAPGTRRVAHLSRTSLTHDTVGAPSFAVFTKGGIPHRSRKNSAVPLKPRVACRQESVPIPNLLRPLFIYKGGVSGETVERFLALFSRSYLNQSDDRPIPPGSQEPFSIFVRHLLEEEKLYETMLNDSASRSYGVRGGIRSKRLRSTGSSLSSTHDPTASFKR